MDLLIRNSIDATTGYQIPDDKVVDMGLECAHLIGDAIGAV
ncbi:MAG TPA: hypothetical protein VFL78_08000 [Rhodanobacteraceae bacterium]|nr:hypothetical protein [Rhodanobacteraceae bacterium]